MIRKLIISAAVLAALIHGKEANAAGVGGFARELAVSPALHMQASAPETFSDSGDAADDVRSPISAADRAGAKPVVNPAVRAHVLASLDCCFDGFGRGAKVAMPKMSHPDFHA